LTYAIPHTIIGRKSSNNTFRPISNLGRNPQYDILEWIGYDNDSFSATETPGWSGFIDLDASTNTALKTNGSNLATTDTIIQNLGGAGIGDAALFFPGEYNENNIGYDNRGSAGAIQVTRINGNKLIVSDLTGSAIKEFYKLAWSAYALVPQPNGDGTFNLVLHYNYQPWQGDSYDNGKSQTLVRNLTVFKFTGSENGVRFKLCQTERIADDHNITTCKEKAVIR
jgi:hypothetical protein